MRYIYNRSSYKKLRQSLRNNATEYERVLWEYLRGREISGLKFRRQYGVERYVMDFYCPQIRLAIEVDGEKHATPESMGYDQDRTELLREHGIKVLRFRNEEIKNAMPQVLEAIEGVINPLLNTGGG